MNKISTFNNPDFGTVRITTINDEPWFVAADVCRALDLSNPTIATNRLDEDERAKFNLGRQGEGTIINEPGLYSLVLGSRKPEAKAFKRWITHDVIPAIRKTGGYVNDTQQFVDYYFSDVNTYGKAAIALMLDETKRMADKLREQEPKVVFADAVETSKTSIPIGDLAENNKSAAQPIKDAIYTALGGGQRRISPAYAHRQCAGFSATSPEILCYKFW